MSLQNNAEYEARLAELGSEIREMCRAWEAEVWISEEAREAEARRLLDLVVMLKARIIMDLPLGISRDGQIAMWDLAEDELREVL